MDHKILVSISKLVCRVGMNPCCATALFKLRNPTKPTRVLDQIVNTTIFHLQSIWLKEVREYLKIGQILNAINDATT
jgi:hypothetical protein